LLYFVLPDFAGFSSPFPLSLALQISLVTFFSMSISQIVSLKNAGICTPFYHPGKCHAAARKAHASAAAAPRGDGSCMEHD
jgi:hypothetical protein